MVGPDPCPDWSVGDLANHLVSGNRRFADLLSGEQPPSLDRLRQSRDIDQLGGDSVAAYDEAGDELRAAFSQPNVLERVFESPIGSVTGVVLLNLRITEILVHRWDLARATGQPARLPDDLARTSLHSPAASSPLTSRAPAASPQLNPSPTMLRRLTGSPRSWVGPSKPVPSRVDRA